MATLIGKYKNGDLKYRLQYDKPGGVRVYEYVRVPDTTSKRSIEKALAQAQADFENRASKNEILTRQEQKAAAQEQERKRAAGILGPDSTLSEWFPKYQATRTDLALSSIKAQTARFNMLRPYLGDTPVSAINRGAVKTTMGALAQKYKPGGVSQALSILRQILGYCVDLEVLTQNPTVGVKVSVPKDSLLDQPEKALSRQELVAFMQAAKEAPLHLQVFFAILIDTGCRRGEGAALTWDDVDFQHGTISITKTWSDCHMSETKNGRHRVVPVTDETLGLLKELRQSQASTGISQYLFPAQTLDRPTATDFGAACERIARRAGLRHVHCHMLRHTLATMSLQGGAPIGDIQKTLGHMRMSTTVNTYLHATQDAAERGAKAAWSYRQGQKEQDKAQ